MNAVACGAGQLHLFSLHARLPSMAPATNRRFEGRLLLPGMYDQVAGSPMDKQSIAVGSSKGFPVTKRVQKQTPANRKGAVTDSKGDNKVARRKVNFVRELIREVTGLAPYEKRVVGAFLVSASNPLFLVMTVHFCRVVEARQGEACFEGC